ncbi:MAG TPA: branched-chain amino acid ABC transporter permease [Stellaceae bacterium]|nr:branched-chain amino acid ABC transporter permease [Stellaceae bacterium]
MASVIGAAARSTRPRISALHGLVAGAALLLALWPLVFGNKFLLALATLVALYAIGAASLHLIIRTGHVSFAHAGFMGVAGYVAVLSQMRLGLPFAAALPLGCLAAATVALAIGPLILRVTGKYFVLVTFLFGEILRLVFTEWTAVTGGSNGIFDVPPPAPVFATPLGFYYLALGAAVLCVGIVARILGSEIGRTIDALREAERLAECSGVPVIRWKVAVFVVACALAGVQGVLQAHYLRLIDPTTFSIVESLNLVVMNVIGGMQRLAGALIGALFLTALPELLRGYVEMQRVFFGIILIIVMAALPGGIIEIGARLRALGKAR